MQCSAHQGRATFPDPSACLDLDCEQKLSEDNGTHKRIGLCLLQLHAVLNQTSSRELPLLVAHVYQ